MPYTPDLIEEMKVLTLFNLDNLQEGIKVHSSARPSAVAATERLYGKGLVTQVDGGYLTDFGEEAARHAQALLFILEPVQPPV
jgi:uncharacterized protein (TIGR02647 family)